jgi:predicted SAM-dependent methyltransferase
MMRSILRAFGKLFVSPATLWRYRELYDATLSRLKSLAGRVRRLFYRPALPLNDGNAVYLHLGCGQINHSKFINIDILPAPHIHYVRSVDNLSIFKDRSVDLIYASHCLEHFPFSVVRSVLKEWYRVLKYAGTLRLSVPDFDLLQRIYQETGNDIDKIIDPLMGSQVNSFDFHKALFNSKNLTQLLETSGFHNVRMWTPGSSELTTFEDWSARCILVNDKNYPVSLNIEAVK